MNTMRENKAFYKKALMILLVGMMGIGVVGCGNSDTKEEKAKEETKDTVEESEEAAIQIPKETMSVEETKALSVGTVIDFKDQDAKIPDEATLEEMGLLAVYLVSERAYDLDGNPKSDEVVTPYGELADELAESGTSEVTIEGETILKLTCNGIEIYEIESYQSKDGVWVKRFVTMNGDQEVGIFGAPVISERILSELGDPQERFMVYPSEL